jgi:hypothetical protein
MAGFVLPPQFDQDFGPIRFAPVDPISPRGLYQLDLRILDTVMGDSLHFDMNQFEIQ